MTEYDADLITADQIAMNAWRDVAMRLRERLTDDQRKAIDTTWAFGITGADDLKACLGCMQRLVLENKRSEAA